MRTKNYFLVLSVVAMIVFCSCGKQTADKGQQEEDENAVQNVQHGNQVGDMFVDFEVKNDGKVQKLSEYVGNGKYVIVDFWASWCAPCRGEIPNLIDIYNRYKLQKVEVLGVCTWDKPEDSKKAIAELGIPYPQILNAQTVGSDAYDFDGIPQIMLFDPDGRILARDLFGEEVEKALKNALSK